MNTTGKEIKTITSAEARKRLNVLQQLSPKEIEVAASIIKILDKVPKKKRAKILLQAFKKANNGD